MFWHISVIVRHRIYTDSGRFLKLFLNLMFIFCAFVFLRNNPVCLFLCYIFWLCRLVCVVFKMMLKVLLLSALLCLGIANAMYVDTDDVVSLTDKTWESFVMDSDDLWMVEFYARKLFFFFSLDVWLRVCVHLYE